MLDFMYELRREELGVTKVGSKPVNKGYIHDPFATLVPTPQPIPEDTGIPSKVTKLRRRKGESPPIAYVRSLGMDAMVASEVAEELGVSTNLVRKWITDPMFKAPSYEVPYGKNRIYLFTPEDVQELRDYIQAQRTPQLRKR